tara:strand:- start:115 stop:333 length:219 start_codon:yes stop_codon:yes gene_type:complete
MQALGFPAISGFLRGVAQFVLIIQVIFVNYSHIFHQRSNKPDLLSKPRKVDFLESLKNPKLVREPYIDLDFT